MRSINRFHDFRPTRHKPDDDYSEEELYEVEVGAAIRLEQSASRLQEGELQSIWFYRTMNHYLEPKAFTLLNYERTRHDRQSDRYIFACELVGAEAEERAELIGRERNAVNEQRIFVNFLKHHYEQYEDSSLLFFPIEIGDRYQGQLLREIRERQKHASIKCQQGCTFKETGVHLPGCAPEAVIKTATITAERDVNGRMNCYAWLPIAFSTRRCLVNPDAVIGFHEDEGSYFFAVINFR